MIALQIYLIDKGIQCEVEFGEIYGFPPELLEFGMFTCVCPVLVPSTEDLSVYKSFIGYKCKCTVGKFLQEQRQDYDVMQA